MFSLKNIFINVYIHNRRISQFGLVTRLMTFDARRPIIGPNETRRFKNSTKSFRFVREPERACCISFFPNRWKGSLDSRFVAPALLQYGFTNRLEKKRTRLWIIKPFLFFSFTRSWIVASLIPTAPASPFLSLPADGAWN